MEYEFCPGCERQTLYQISSTTWKCLSCLDEMSEDELDPDEIEFNSDWFPDPSTQQTS